jgi:formylglycine-generating enzyme required for sulfatase activity
MEYVTRAGAVTSRYFGETEELLPRYAWYVKNSKELAWPVGSLKPNDLGMFDVHGNVWTWCQEGFKNYLQGKDEQREEDKEEDLTINYEGLRVLRGGSFLTHASLDRSAYRFRLVPSTRNLTFGFRPARTFAP